MPWQQHVLDVALEIDPATGRLVYREVNLTVPRQSGKTTLLLPKAVWRAEAAKALGGRQTLLYAAQTGNDARKKWRKEFVPALNDCKVMQGRYRVRLANGDEQIQFRGGSSFGPTATTEKAGHGETLDDGTLDEAFAQVDDRVEQSWRPAMITRPQPQFWVVSTAGTRTSTYLRRKVDRGRAAVEAGSSTGVAYFEWSADPSADPGDPATWWSCMPALGHTVSEEAVRAEFEGMTLSEFRRAFCNQWTDQVLDSVLPGPSWAACRDPHSRRDGQAVLAPDVSPDRSSAAVSFAANRVDGLPMIQVVRHGPGTSWVVEHVEQMAREKGIREVVMDSTGQVASLRPDLEKALKPLGIPLRMMKTGDVADACGVIYDATVTEQLRHTGQDSLDVAVSGAAKRDLGDRWAWKRRTSSTDITPLVSATNALWGLCSAPAETEVWGFFQ